MLSVPAFAKSPISCNLSKIGTRDMNTERYVYWANAQGEIVYNRDGNNIVVVIKNAKTAEPDTLTFDNLSTRYAERPIYYYPTRNVVVLKDGRNAIVTRYEARCRSINANGDTTYVDFIRNYAGNIAQGLSKEPHFVALILTKDKKRTYYVGTNDKYAPNAKHKEFIDDSQRLPNDKN